MSSIYSKLPLEIIVYILKFDNAIRYRNGKFIDQINQRDGKYSLLNNFAPIEKCIVGNSIFKYIRVVDKLYLSLYISRDNSTNKYTYTYAKKTEKNKVIPPIYIYQSV
jgi:hypothetical protein